MLPQFGAPFALRKPVGLSRASRSGAARRGSGPPSALSTSLTFTASGANNDIEVMLLEASQFQNWEKRNKFTVAYQSGRVTSDKLAIPLPAQEGT